MVKVPNSDGLYLIPIVLSDSHSRISNSFKYHTHCKETAGVLNPLDNLEDNKLPWVMPTYDEMKNI